MKINMMNQAMYWSSGCAIFTVILFFGIILELKNIEFFVIPFCICFIVANIFIGFGMMMSYNKQEQRKQKQKIWTLYKTRKP